MFKKCWFFNVISMPCWHKCALIELWTVFEDILNHTPLTVAEIEFC